MFRVLAFPVLVNLIPLQRKALTRNLVTGVDLY